ncbi:sideroflexin-1 [Cricetulus griseus]|uniref:Sideroflexin-1 n=1 Tax=Cricetulus griseus TaxID=10029 RepID=A0A061IGB8_CRIGR|nr:sideroflexin-1 [Cricetulus griseus]
MDALDCQVTRWPLEAGARRSARRPPGGRPPAHNLFRQNDGPQIDAWDLHPQLPHHTAEHRSFSNPQMAMTTLRTAVRKSHRNDSLGRVCQFPPSSDKELLHLFIQRNGSFSRVRKEPLAVDKASVWFGVQGSGTMSGEVPPNINIKEPRWDQSTFVGRANHFFTVTDPRNILLTNEQLENARKVVHDYRQGIIPAGLTENELWRAKYVYDSAFHPDTGEKMILIGRMSAQVPMNMTITGCMMTFYRTTPAVLFWQWINQSFNAVVNYTNRSGDAPLTVNELGTAYVSATTGAVATALGLNALTKRVSPLIGRFVPFAAVAAANCINIPLMRQRELKVGIPVTDENGTRLGESTNAAKQAITQVVISRILMAAPGMAIPPFIMNTLEKKAFLKRFPWMSAPIQVTLVGFCLVFATPLCCALFPQKSSMSVTSLEDELQASIQRSHPELRRVYFNKGL